MCNAVFPHEAGEENETEHAGECCQKKCRKHARSARERIADDARHQHPGKRDGGADGGVDGNEITQRHAGAACANIGEDQRVECAINRNGDEQRKRESPNGRKGIDHAVAQRPGYTGSENGKFIVAESVRKDAHADTGRHVDQRGNETQDRESRIGQTEFANADQRHIGRGGGTSEAEDEDTGSRKPQLVMSINKGQRRQHGSST
ncbi:hypothetical protein QE369_001498 [Agrobacterium larrymoorei]|uniref:Uncharacterized protein n=1 Tax=Agrobacterium larrymoorei TaxID=160699 RepID=A0AAJ2EQL2_9HYPH|nr:hypothetical protein [Agrobacterium larrymoorei]